jgi:hypothetical protein
MGGGQRQPTPSLSPPLSLESVVVDLFSFEFGVTIHLGMD